MENKLNQTNQQEELYTVQELETALHTIDMLVFKFRPYCKIYDANIMGNTYEVVKIYLRFQDLQMHSLFQSGIITEEEYQLYGCKYYNLHMEALKIYAQQNNY